LVDPQKRFIEHTYIINRLECVFYPRAHSESLVNVTAVDAVGVRDEVDFCSEEYGPGRTKGRKRGVSWTYTKTFCVGIAEGRKEHYRI